MYYKCYKKKYPKITAVQQITIIQWYFRIVILTLDNWFWRDWLCRRKEMPEIQLWKLESTWTCKNPAMQSKGQFCLQSNVWSAIVVVFCTTWKVGPIQGKAAKAVKVKLNKTCVINDPLSQTHSPTSSDHYFHTTFVRFAIFWKVGTDVRTVICAKIMITTGWDCGSAEWINKSSEFKVIHQAQLYTRSLVCFECMDGWT